MRRKIKEKKARNVDPLKIVRELGKQFVLLTSEERKIILEILSNLDNCFDKK